MRLYVDRGTLSAELPGLTQEPRANQVVFDGDWVEGQMVWDAGIDNVRATTPEERLAAARAARCRHVDVEHEARKAAGFQYMGKTIQSRPADRENISNAAQTAMLCIITSQQFSLAPAEGWRCEDNSYLVVDAQQMVGMQVAMMERGAALFAAAQSIKDRVKASQTPWDEDITQGWPD